MVVWGMTSTRQRGEIMTNDELSNLESAQERILFTLRAMLATDDPDSYEILTLAQMLRNNDDRINQLLLDN
jgi:hypothetical protein